jgi:hypothetical protein
MAYSLNSVYKSLIAQIQGIIEDVKASGISDDLQYHAWDSRGDTTELPDTDLIGLVDWTYAENGGLSVVNTGIMLSTRNDQNLFKEVLILDAIRKACVNTDRPGDYLTWKIYDNNGEQYTWFQVSEFEVLPSGRSEVRNTRHIGIELMKTENV